MYKFVLLTILITFTSITVAGEPGDNYLRSGAIPESELQAIEINNFHLIKNKRRSRIKRSIASTTHDDHVKKTSSQPVKLKLED